MVTLQRLSSFFTLKLDGDVTAGSVIGGGMGRDLARDPVGAVQPRG